MCAILLAVILICAAESSHSVDVARCSNGTQSELTLTPHNDGVVGRYLAEMCMDLEPEATSWKLTLTFYDKDYNCKHPPLMGIHRPGKVHSTYEQTITVDGNCSHVCLNTTFDLIFSACYAIESFFIVNGYTRHITYTYFNIKNEYTKEDFMHNMALVDVLNHDEENMTIIWHTGVPFVDFDLSACKILNATAGVIEQEPACTRVTECRAPSAAELRCRAALPDGCYELLLTLHATWTHGTFRDQGLVKHTYCKAQARLPPARGRSAWAGAWAWALGALAAACGAGAAVRAACRSREARALHKAVLREWLVHRSESGAAAAAAEAPAPRKHILVLYAREAGAGARLGPALADLLQHAPGTQVHDLFSPATMAAAAPAPAEWLRGMLSRDEVAVVLLQTPALACLYRTELVDSDSNLKLSGPLLGRRVAYRAPQFGDALLQLAARLLADAPRRSECYRKYYLATLSELPTEVFPQLVPFRRYALPGAAALLARDVGAAAPPAALAALHAAAADFARHAADCPDYLMEDLVLL